MNADDVTVIVTAGLVASACGLLGPFLVLRRQALMGDAVRCCPASSRPTCCSRRARRCR